MNIDWPALLTQHRVEFITRGANVKRGELNIHCPFCGAADPSYHMGINPDSGWWACWRNAEHRGKSPVRLLCRLLRISGATARSLLGLDELWIDPDGFGALADRLLRGIAPRAAEEERPQALDFPQHFRALRVGDRACARHVAYLQSRGFDDVQRLAERYELAYSLDGEWRDRVIIPYFVQDQLVTWQARAVAAATLRYKELSPKVSAMPAHDTLFNVDATTNAELVVLVEGPMDALKLDFYGRGLGVRAVALSTNSVREPQLLALHRIACPVLVMMDSPSALAGVVDNAKMRGRLSALPNVRSITVPFGCKDAGDFNPGQAREFVRSLYALQ